VLIGPLREFSIKFSTNTTINKSTTTKVSIKTTTNFSTETKSTRNTGIAGAILANGAAAAMKMERNESIFMNSKLYNKGKRETTKRTLDVELRRSGNCRGALRLSGQKECMT
jgi:hypothetical protein